MYNYLIKVTVSHFNFNDLWQVLVQTLGTIRFEFLSSAMMSYMNINFNLLCSVIF